MTRLLILGGSGMLGHKLWQVARPNVETFATVRNAAAMRCYGLPEPEMIGGVDAAVDDSVIRALVASRPDVVVNCVGIVKQLAEAHDPIRSISINALFPHRLAALCAAAGARLIHISTDCVFSGRKGMYTERDPSDAEDLYGRTKFLGEVVVPPALTLRTSIIGRELESEHGLIEWFLANKGGSVRGFTKAIYSGLTTQMLARMIVRLILEFPALSGLYHVSSQPISKYELLMMVKKQFHLQVEITPDSSVVVDRSLDSTEFRRVTGFEEPCWPAMVREMAEDPTPYDEWRARLAS